MALLQLERISAQYPGAAEPVLADISLTLGPQQLLVALGPSGSGKTSLLNLIAGFVEPSAGRIQLDGVPVQAPAPNAAWCSRTMPCCPGRTCWATSPSAWSWLAWPATSAKPGLGKCLPWWTWPASTSAASGSSPVARSSVWAWPAPWRPTRGCC